MPNYEGDNHNDYTAHGSKAQERRLPCTLILGRFLILCLALAGLAAMMYFNLGGL